MEILLARTSNASRASMRSVTANSLLPGSHEPTCAVLEGALRFQQSPTRDFGYMGSGENPPVRRFAILSARRRVACARSVAMLPPSSSGSLEDDQAVGDAYERHLNLLGYLARTRFRVPQDDVTPLVHDVFVSYLRHRTRIQDERKWLVGAIYNRCRDYWSRRGKLLPPETPIALREDADAILERLDLIAVVARLPEPCQGVLRRIAEGYSMRELAEWLATNSNNAKQIVHRCKVRARKLFCIRRGETP
jgi:RNA polymerase sigma factor (sigma-70 family)